MPMSADDLNLEELRRLLEQSQGATPLATPSAEASPLPSIINEILGPQVTPLAQPMVEALPRPPGPITPPNQSPVSEPTFGSFRGRQATNAADPGFVDRQNQLGSFRDGRLADIDSRAGDNRKLATQLAAIGMQTSVAGGTPNMSPFIDAVNRENTTRNSTDIARIAGATSDNDRVGDFVRKAFEDTRVQEGQDYTRGQDAIQNRRADANLSMRRQEFDRGRYQMMEGVLTPEGRPVFVDRNSTNGGTPRVVDSEGNQVRDLRSLRGNGSNGTNPLGGTAQSSQKGVDALLQNAADSRNSLAQIDRLGGLFNDIDKGMLGVGDITRVPGVNSALQGITGVTGIGDGAKREEADRVINELKVRASKLIQGQGQVTDGERKMLADTLPSLGISMEANQAILNVMRRVEQRNIQEANDWVQHRQSPEGSNADYSTWRATRPAPVDPSSGSASTPVPSATPTRTGGDPLEQARQAISRGAPRDAVIQRLRDNGIDPGGL